MTCEYYCPACQTGNCPKIKELVEEKAFMQASIVAFIEEMEKAWVELREANAGGGILGLIVILCIRAGFCH